MGESALAHSRLIRSEDVLDQLLADLNLLGSAEKGTPDSPNPAVAEESDCGSLWEELYELVKG